MVPPTLRTGFHYIGGVFVAGALQFHNVAAVGDALSILWQAVSEYIGHESHVDFFTNGEVLLVSCISFQKTTAYSVKTVEA